MGKHLHLLNLFQRENGKYFRQFIFLIYKILIYNYTGTGCIALGPFLLDRFEIEAMCWHTILLHGWYLQSEHET